MAVRGIALLLAGLLLAGCVHTQLEPASDVAMTTRDKKLLANAPYAKANIPVAYQRAIVRYHRKEAPGTIVIDSDARYLYYVLPDNQAIRYGVIVGEEAQSWSGVARGGRKKEWQRGTPPGGEKRRLGPLPNYVEGGPANRPRDLPLLERQGHALPHPWHQPAGMDRACDLVGLHPNDQRRRDRPLQSRQNGHDRSDAGTKIGGVAGSASRPTL